MLQFQISSKFLTALFLSQGTNTIELSINGSMVSADVVDATDGGKPAAGKLSRVALFDPPHPPRVWTSQSWDGGGAKGEWGLAYYPSLSGEEGASFAEIIEKEIVDHDPTAKVRGSLLWSYYTQN